MISYCKNGKSAQVLACPQATFDQIVDSPQVAAVCRQLATTDHDSDAAKQLKQQLPLLMFMATYADGRRHAESAQPTGMAYLDLDELGGEDPRAVWTRLRTLIVDRQLDDLVRLVHVSCSGRGLRIVYAIPAQFAHLAPAEQIEASKQWLATELGVVDDAKTKDLARGSFAVPRAYILSGPDSRLFEATVPLSADGGAAASLPPQPTALNTSPLTLNTSPLTLNTPPPQPSFRGIPYATIISAWWRRTGGEPQTGERNVKLHKLAVNLRAICDNRRELLMAVMPRYGLSEAELRSIVDSACKEEPKGVSKLLTQIVDDELSRMEDEVSSFSSDVDASSGDDASEAEADPSASVPPPSLRRALPIGLKESLVGVPPSMHMAVLCGVLPIAAAYADQVEVEYCDGNRQHLGLMSIIYGEQASNKSVVKNAVDVWKRQFDEEDALARRREEEWKERKKSRKANEKAPEDPKVLVRMVPVTVSCSTLLKRFKNAQGHTLYSFGEELDTLRKTNGAGSWSSKYDIYRLSFDRGEWGQDYNSDQAESGVVNVAYNWTMLGTRGALAKCFRQDNIENGLSSRILVAQMPDASFQKMPKFGRRSADDEARIQKAVTRLRSCAGLADVPRLRKAIEEWVEQKRVEAAKDIDHVKDTYRRRAAVIGFRCGVVCHLLSACQRESKTTLDFALLMADYCLQQQTAAFGPALQSEYVSAQDEGLRRGVNHTVFDQLAPTFTFDDLRALKGSSCSDAALRMIISRWGRDGWINKTGSRHWTKAKEHSESK